jgi:polar amino acid transport system permease protein
MLTEFTLWDILRNLALGAAWTIGLSLTAFVCGGLVGLLVLTARIGRHAWLRRLMRGYIELFQGTPLLMQLFMIFFGIALAGIDVPPWLAAALGLTLFTSAYLAEIWRGCVEAIPKGQWEASASLAMGWLEQMRHVVLPQALRIAVAPTVGFSVQVVKATSVTSIIGFAELTKTGSMLANATFQPFLVFGLVALGYFILCYPLSLFAARLERTFHGAGAH